MRAAPHRREQPIRRIPMESAGSPLDVHEIRSPGPDFGRDVQPIRRIRRNPSDSVGFLRIPPDGVKSLSGSVGYPSDFRRIPSDSLGLSSDCTWIRRIPSESVGFRRIAPNPRLNASDSVGFSSEFRRIPVGLHTDPAESDGFRRIPSDYVEFRRSVGYSTDSYGLRRTSPPPPPL